jgi:hypothetical protein
LGFIKDYKFTIAFENSAVPGYTSEKLLEPILVKSIPVYFGNPLVYLDFEPGSFIKVDSRADFDRLLMKYLCLTMMMRDTWRCWKGTNSRPIITWTPGRTN